MQSPKASLLWLSQQDLDAERIARRLEQAGWVVSSVSTEAEAAAVLGAGAVSLVLLDADAAGGACWRVLRTLLRAGDKAPVVLLADGKDISSRVRALEAGCADLLAKPVSGAELVARLSGVLRGARLRDFFRIAARGEGTALLAEGVSVQDVMSGFSQGKTSGSVLLRHRADDAATGVLSVKDGRLTGARYGDAQGNDALLLASMLAPDLYVFEAGVGDPGAYTQPLQGSTSELLASLDVRLSSWQQLAEQLPPLDHYVLCDPTLASDAGESGGEESTWVSELDGSKTLFALLSTGEKDILRAAADVARLHAISALRVSSAPIAAQSDEGVFGAVSTRQASLKPSVMPCTVVRPASGAPLSRTTTLAPPSSISGSAWLSPSVGPRNGVPSDEIPLPSSSAVMVLPEDLSSVHDLSVYDAPVAANVPEIEPEVVTHYTAQVATIREHVPAESSEFAAPGVRMFGAERDESALSEAERVARAWPSQDAEPAESEIPSFLGGKRSGRRSGRVVAAAFLALLLAVTGVLVYARREVRGKGEVDPALLNAALGEPSSLAVSGTFARTDQTPPALATPYAEPAVAVAIEPFDAGMVAVAVARAAPTAPVAAPTKSATPSLEGGALLSRKQLETALDRGQFKRVIEQGERAVETKPDDGEIWALIGVAYQATGQGPKAKEAYANCAKYASGQTKAECVRYAK